MLLTGNCLDELKNIPDKSIDSIVTDPPYGLNFMGKKWDYDVPSTDIWIECLRVLKPGGHLLSFFGTRTYHRGVVRIEDAGFEIRDQIQWNFGSGFPKSHNLKDEHKGWGSALKPAHETIAVCRKPLTEVSLMTSLALELCQSPLFVDAVKNHSTLNLKEKTLQNIVQWIAGKNTLTQVDLFALMDTLRLEWAPPSSLSTEFSWLNTLAAVLSHANTFTTEITLSLTTDLKILKFLLLNSTQKNTHLNDGHGEKLNVSLVQNLFCALELKLNYILIHSVQENVTSSDAVTNSLLNSGTANEPIVVARKPLEKGLTIAENVLKYGTGAINIDGSRIGTETRVNQPASTLGNLKTMDGGKANPNQEAKSCEGRWPANIIFDETAAKMLDEQSGVLKTGGVGTFGQKITGQSTDFGWDRKARTTANSTGGASRFFYVAKASKSERNAGLDGMEAIESQSTGWSGDSMPLRQNGTERKMPVNQNHHPTVKPIKLMSYLINLVTPPNGTILDPFMGSGSTGCAAKKLGFKFIGIEMNEEYINIAKKRIENVTRPNNT